MPSFQIRPFAHFGGTCWCGSGWSFSCWTTSRSTDRGWAHSACAWTQCASGGCADIGLPGCKCYISNIQIPIVPFEGLSTLKLEKWFWLFFLSLFHLDFDDCFFKTTFSLPKLTKNKFNIFISYLVIYLIVSGLKLYLQYLNLFGPSIRHLSVLEYLK